MAAVAADKPTNKQLAETFFEINAHGDDHACRYEDCKKKNKKVAQVLKNACTMFLIEPEPAAPAAAAAAVADGRVDFQAALKKRKMDAEKKGSNYINLSFIPTGSVEVESLLSTAKYIATDRARLLPVTLEMLMFLKHNRRFWDVSHVHEALQLPDSELFDDDDGDDE